jgi:hypothetical protein
MEKEVSPWDLIHPSNYTTDDVSEKRYSICNSCPLFSSLTKRCNECGCFMTLKTKLKYASCPVGKW